MNSTLVMCDLDKRNRSKGKVAAKRKTEEPVNDQPFPSASDQATNEATEFLKELNKYSKGP